MKRFVGLFVVAWLVTLSSVTYGQDGLSNACNTAGLISKINEFALSPVAPRCEPVIVNIFCKALAQENTDVLNKEARAAGCLDKYSHILPARESAFAYAYVAQRTHSPPSPSRERFFKAVWSERSGLVRYVRIAHFMLDDTAARFQKEIDDIAPTERLIIDLRGNQGGGVDGALRIASLFAPRAGLTLAISRNAASTTPYLTQARGKLANTPTMVLVDEQTASAAEIMAAMMYEVQPRYVRIMGRQTYGKASYSIPIFYRSGGNILATLNFTSGEVVVGHSGRRVEGRGVSPHYLLTRDFMAGGRASLTDAVTMHALKYHGEFNP